MSSEDKEAEVFAKLALTQKADTADELKEVGSHRRASMDKDVGEKLATKLMLRPDRSTVANMFMKKELMADNMFNKGSLLNSLIANRSSQSKLKEMNIISEVAIDSRADRLKTLLDRRADKSRLLDMNIIPESGDMKEESDMSNPVDGQAAASSSNNMVSKQSNLGKLLSKRVDKAQLTNLNIIKEEGGNGKIAAAALKLKQSQTKDALSNFLTSRPNQDFLKTNRILLEEQKPAGQDAKQVLQSFLKNRLSLSQLVDKSIVSDAHVTQQHKAHEHPMSLTFAHVQALGSNKIMQISSGWGHNCVLSDKNQVFVFGAASNGKLGLGEDNQKDVDTPTLLQALDKIGKVTTLACGDNHSCAVINGDVYAWGAGSWGRLGTESLSDVWTPTAVHLPDDEDAEKHVRVKSVSCGSYHTVFLAEDGRVFACGWNKHGRIGVPAKSTPSLTVASAVQLKMPEDTPMVAVRAGEHCSFSWDAKGQLYAWGCGANGMLGNGDEQDQFEPVAVKGISVKDLSVASTHVLAITSSGKLVGWGNNKDNQLGAGSLDAGRNGPIDIGLDNVTAIAAGKSHSLAVSGGVTYSFGKGKDGVLGHGDENSEKVPKAVKLDKKVVNVAAGWTHSVLLTADGSVFTCGSGSYCKLGY